MSIVRVLNTKNCSVESNFFADFESIWLSKKYNVKLPFLGQNWNSKVQNTLCPSKRSKYRSIFRKDRKVPPSSLSPLMYQSENKHENYDNQIINCGNNTVFQRKKFPKSRRLIHLWQNMIISFWMNFLLIFLRVMKHVKITKFNEKTKLC